MKNIIGREKETTEINRLYNSSIPQFCGWIQES